MTDAPAFDFYPERWLSGVASMSDSEQISYLRLLCFSWIMDGLPADGKSLRRLGGRGVTDAVISKFPETNGLRRNPRLEEIRMEQRERILKSRNKIDKMNSARAAKHALQEPLQEPLQEELQGPSCRLPHHSPLTPVLLEKEPKGAFAPPSLEEWIEHGKSQSPPFPEIECQSSHAHYESNGWKVGQSKAPCKKWKSAFQTCYLRWKKESANPNGQMNFRPVNPSQREPIYDKAPEIKPVPESDRPSLADISNLKQSLNGTP